LLTGTCAKVTHAKVDERNKSINERTYVCKKIEHHRYDRIRAKK